MNVMQVTPIENSACPWIKALLYVGMCGVLLLSQYVLASDGEFLSDASGGLEGIIRGHGGKIVVLVGLVFASFYTAVKKDWSHFMSIVGLAFGIGIVIGIINKVFTAVI